VVAVASSIATVGCSRPVVSSPPILVTANTADILRRLTDWEKATDQERLAAANAVAAADADFELLDVRPFTGNDHFDGPNDPGQAFHIAVFRHKPTALEFSLIPGGTFQMGSMPGDPRATANDSPAHQVTLTNPFFICRTKATNAAWARVPSGMQKPDIYPTGPGDYFGDVSWETAEEWCRNARLSLPTEAQWEWAVRGGTRGAYYFDARHFPGLDPMPRLQVAPPSGIGANLMTARRGPNAFGLHDALHLGCGLAEWTRDGYMAYSPEPVVDPDHSDQSRKMFRTPCWVGDQFMPFPVWTRRCKEDDWVLYHNTFGVRPEHDIRIAGSMDNRHR
jgi:formylglycine-generating enzyme required for sulfatase activity